MPGANQIMLTALSKDTYKDTEWNIENKLEREHDFNAITYIADIAGTTYIVVRQMYAGLNSLILELEEFELDDLDRVCERILFECLMR